MGEMRVAMRQGDIRSRDSRLRNLIARIRPIPIFIPGRGAQDPDPAYFPKYADQFYGLRKPPRERDYQVLDYLSKFYDIWLEAAAADESQSSEEKAQVDPEQFRARAQQLAHQGAPPAAEKRGRPATSSSGGGPQPQPQRRKLHTPSEGALTVQFTDTPGRAPPTRPVPAG
ncbi:hypothetical protein B0H63DRAFT_451293 [Podospora didyma]|uniref:Uncharacterized protein n=1 Tax=Podospora didyma TaxID=330526 RepID=A0AAE0TWG9_9PEZI|nr:hypothetical protein B0H63DRAFT_451293 [Podospora didyma]